MQNAAAKLILGGEEAGPCDTIPSRTALAPRVPTSHLQNSSVGIQNIARRWPFVSAGFVKPYSCDRDGMRSADDITRLDEPATQYKTFGDRAFSVLGPKMWNMLPKDVRLSTSVTSFKTALKTHLFQIAYT